MVSHGSHIPSNCFLYQNGNPSKIEWDLTNGPLSKLLELLDTQVQGSVQWVPLEISWRIWFQDTLGYRLIASPRPVPMSSRNVVRISVENGGLVGRVGSTRSPLKIGNPKRKLVFQSSIFRGYVEFRDCKLFFSSQSGVDKQFFDGWSGKSISKMSFFWVTSSFARLTRTSERQLSKKSFISNGEQVGIDSCHHLGRGTKLLSEFRQNTIKTCVFLNTSHVFVLNRQWCKQAYVSLFSLNFGTRYWWPADDGLQNCGVADHCRQAWRSCNVGCSLQIPLPFVIEGGPRHFVCLHDDPTKPFTVIICTWYFWIESLEQNDRLQEINRCVTRDMNYRSWVVLLPQKAPLAFRIIRGLPLPKILRKRCVDFRHRRDFQLDDKALRKAEVGTLQQKKRVRQWFLTVFAILTGWPKTKRWRHKTWWPWCQRYPHTWHLKEKGIDDFYAKLWLPSCSWLNPD